MGAKGYGLLGLRVVLGALFVAAGVLKLRDPQAFSESVKAFKLVEASHLRVMLAFAIPWAEVIAGALLVLGAWTRGAALVLAVMLAGFVGGIVSVIARDMNVTCGCFGKYEWPCVGAIGVCHVVRNAVLLAMALGVAALGGGACSLEGLGRTGAARG